MSGAFPLPHPWVPGQQSDNPFEDRVQENFDAIAVKVGSLSGLSGAVSALPTTPTDGQEISFTADATNGVKWLLKYRAASASIYKWEYIGGSPLSAEVVTSAHETTTSTTYVALTTTGPSITLPLAGDYDIEQSMQFQNTALGMGAMSYDIGATGAVDADAAAQYQQVATVGTVLARRVRRKAGLAAVTLTSKYRTDTGNLQVLGTTGLVGGHRLIRATPVRVG